MECSKPFVSFCNIKTVKYMDNIKLYIYMIQFTVRPGPPNGSTQTNSYGKNLLIWEKPHFLGVQKTSRGNIRGNTPDSIYTTSTEGKIPSGYCSKTPYKVSKILVLPRLPLKPYILRLCIACVKSCACP